jgi:PAS domain S-box-containing protein
MPPRQPKYDPDRPVESPKTGPDKGSNLSNGEAKIHADRYQMLIEAVADGFYEVDLNGNFRFFNQALSRIFGYAPTEIRGHNFREFMNEDNARVAFEAFNRIYRSGKGDVYIEWKISRKDGQERHLEISASLIEDEHGQATGFRGIARDVTDRILAQQALKESEACALELSQTSRRAEQRYRAFLEFLPDPVFVFNLDNTVYYLNPAFEKVFGWTLKELEGKIIPFVPEDSKEDTNMVSSSCSKKKPSTGLKPSV